MLSDFLNGKLLGHGINVSKEKKIVEIMKCSPFKLSIRCDVSTSREKKS
jgi:hypothetical protein